MARPPLVFPPDHVSAAPHGEFSFILPRAAAARIAIFCSQNQTMRLATMHRAVDIIGQTLCDEQSTGTFSWDRVRRILWDAGWTKPRTRRVIGWLVACDVLVEGTRGVRICQYERNNRSRADWVVVQEARRAAKRAQKRATRLAAADKQRTQCSFEALETPLLVANSAFVSVSYNTPSNSNPNPPPKPPTLVPNGGGRSDLKTRPPTPAAQTCWPGVEAGRTAEPDRPGGATRGVVCQSRTAVRSTPG